LHWNSRRVGVELATLFPKCSQERCSLGSRVQQTLGHKPTNANGLGMTGNYTHTRPETQRRQIEQALRHWPASLRYAVERIGAAKSLADG
jgi:hypothetical protein